MDLLLSCRIMGISIRQYPLRGPRIREGGTVTGRAVPRRWPLWRVAVAERSMEPALRPG